MILDKELHDILCELGLYWCVSILVIGFIAIMVPYIARVVYTLCREGRRQYRKLKHYSEIKRFDRERKNAVMRRTFKREKICRKGYRLTTLR